MSFNKIISIIVFVGVTSLLTGFTCITVGISQTITPENFTNSINQDPFAEEDPLAEPDPFTLQNEDPLNEDNNVLPNENKNLIDKSINSLESRFEEIIDLAIPDQVNTREFTLKANFNQSYRLNIGRSFTNLGISFTGNIKKDTNDTRLVHKLVNEIKIHTSPFVYYHFKLVTKLFQFYNTNTNIYSDFYSFKLTESYTNYQKGAHQIRLGSQIFKLGRVDFDSPLDVLNPTNSNAILSLELEDSKNAVLALKYDFVGKSYALRYFLAPLQPKSSGIEFTNYRDDINNSTAMVKKQKGSSVKPHMGFQYQYVTDSIDLRLSAFHWFDTNNKIRWQSKIHATDGFLGNTADRLAILTDYNEEETTVDFVSFEIDGDFGEFITLKSDFAYFWNKNFYHFNINSSDLVTFKTYTLDHYGFSFSVENHFQYFFIIPIYSYRKIYAAPSDSHIVFYENEATPKAYQRDIIREQLSLAILTRFRHYNVEFFMFQTKPFDQFSLLNVWTWVPENSSLDFRFKIFRGSTETIQMFSKRILSNQYFIQITYVY